MICAQRTVIVSAADTSATGGKKPAGTAIGAVVGGVYALFAGDSAERRQQHREAQRAREAMAEQLKRLSHELRPVSDYFRSAGMQNLPGIGTFGGASLAAQAAGGARL